MGTGRKNYKTAWALLHKLRRAMAIPRHLMSRVKVIAVQNPLTFLQMKAQGDSFPCAVVFAGPFRPMS
jgi:hypothetical protein